MKLSKALASASPFPLEPESPSRSRTSALSKLDHSCLATIAGRLNGARLELRLWDGTAIATSGLSPVGSITIKDRGTLWRLVLQHELAFGEGYMSGDVEVAGDLTQMIASANLSPERTRQGDLLRWLDRLLFLTSEDVARKYVHQHYDLGNAFYRLWLDEAMIYTCAYFERPDAELEDAQQAKLEYVCRKLELRPGDRVIEAGCGWGALAIYMATHYGAQVRAYNISAEQLRYATAAAAAHGVSDRVTFIDGPFQAITGDCDAFVSVGMLEHVGAGGYRDLGRVIDRVLDPVHGRGLLHFIGRNQRRAFDPWIRRYIFPGAYAPVLAEVTADIFEPWDVSVLDVENLRRHYAATLRHWRSRFERRAADVARMFDDRFVRMWRLYLASAEASFTSGDLQLFQVTFGRAADNTGRATRADLYADRPAEGTHDGHV